MGDEFLAFWVFDHRGNCAYTLLYAVEYRSRLFFEHVKSKKSHNERAIFFYFDFNGSFDFKEDSSYLIDKIRNLYL